ncbi:MAG TPA: hypothetical protein VGE40_11715 [Bacilli bacterium]
MLLTQKELGHVVFLSQMILDGNKKGLMPEAIQCLLYIVKSLSDVALSDDVSEEIRLIIVRVEEELRLENIRMKEIKQNLNGSNRKTYR